MKRLSSTKLSYVEGEIFESVFIERVSGESVLGKSTL